MGKQRAALDFASDSETVDIEELAGKSRKGKHVVDPETLQRVAEQSGFPSRENARKTLRRRKKSPYTMQLGLKVRPAMRELFQEMGAHLDVYDHTTFERAVLALIEKEGTTEQKKTYEGIVK